MQDRLKGHVALVTGGGRGIGRAISERLYSEGADLAICGTSAAVLEDTAKALEDAGGRQVFYQRCDVSDDGSIRDLVTAAAERFGKVDVLVNNAAVTLGQFGRERIDVPFHELDEEVWDANLDINLKGPWFLARAVYPYMAQQQWGRVINIGSSTVYFGRGNCAAYIASKAGLIGLTRAMSFDLGKQGITCNCI
ncbi:MAG: SDR family oxidoreductase, partial [Pseudomonadota bacterium]|nr:SDR family oxidoreductase [Pseudomonadota bacterium]